MQFEMRKARLSIFAETQQQRDPPLGLRDALSQIPPSLSDNELIVILPRNSKRSRLKSKLRKRCLQLKVFFTFGYPIFAIFTCIAITAGVLVVCSASANRKAPPCKLTFKAMVRDMRNQNSNPLALATGDFNNDSLLDIVVANSKTENIGVSLGSGNGVLAKQKTYSTGVNSAPCSVAVGDLNNDRYLDIAVANSGSHTIGLFLGNGNGSFKLPVVLSTGVSRPLVVTIGDVNNDQYLDLVALNYGTNDLLVFIGHGDESFTSSTTYWIGYDSLPYSIALVDLNGDKYFDIVVANYMSNSIGVLLNYRNGSFAGQKSYSVGVGSRPYFVVAGDFNSDNKSDVMVANSGSGNLCLLRGTGQGTFEQRQIITTNTLGPSFLVAGDFNKDSYLDVVIANYWNSRIHMVLGSRNGSFTRKRIYSTGFGSYPTSIVAGDFNSDDRLDVAVSNSGTNTIGIYLGYDLRVFETENIYSTGEYSNPRSVVTGDFNNDSRVDIVVGNNKGDSIGVFYGLSNGSFSNQVLYSTGANSTPSFICVGDLNNDGQLDVVVVLAKIDSVGIFFGRANGTFSNMQNVSIGLGSTPRSVGIGDFNQDRCMDLVIGKYNTENVGVFLGYCNGSFANQTKYYTGSITNPDVIAVADMNNDRHLDIIVVDSFANNFTIFFGHGNGTFRNQTTYSSKFGLSATSLAVADVDRDDRLDLVIAYSLSKNIVIFFGGDNETFDNEVTYPNDFYSAPYSVSVGDIDNDNISDIVVANYLTNNIGIMLGFANGTFNAQVTYATGNGSGPYALTMVNVDNDELLDIVVTYSLSDDVVVLLAYDYGALRTQSLYTTGAASQPVSIAVGDFNGDRRPDMAVVDYGTAVLEIRLQASDGSYSHDISYPTGSGSLPFDVVIGDFNRDHILDVALTNFGSHTLMIFYGLGNGSFTLKTVLSTGVNSSPSTLAIVDINDDTWSDLVIANAGSNTISIFLGYQYPSFPTPDTYAIDLRSHPLSVIVADLNNDQHLDIVSSTDGQATGSVFLGYGNGTFRLETVFSTSSFREAQLIASGYFDDDECVDLVTVNVFHSVFAIFTGACNGSFENRGVYVSENHTYPSSIITGDFNKDGLADVALAFGGSDSIDVFLNIGNGTLGNVTVYSTGPGTTPSALSKGDFNNDTHLDIVVTNYNASSVTIFFGNSNGTFEQQRTYSTGSDSQPGMIVVGDFNSDRQLDILVVNLVNNQVGVLLAIRNGTFATQIKHSITLIDQPSSIAAGDFNGDDYLDLIVTSSEKDTLRIYHGNGDATFGLEAMYAVGEQSSPMSLAIGDFNGDQQQDVAVANYATSNIAVFIGYCCEPFLSQTTVSTGNKSVPQSVATGDFNHDNATDLVVANSETYTMGIFLGYGDGTFTNQTTFPTGNGSSPVSVAVVDLDHDGWLDILVANYKSGTIGIFLGFGNGTFANMITYPLEIGSYPSLVVLVKLTGSTEFDVIVTDHGNNIVYLLRDYHNGSFAHVTTFATGYKSQPYAIAPGDFNNDTEIDLAVALAGTSNIGFISKTC